MSHHLLRPMREAETPAVAALHAASFAALANA